MANIPVVSVVMSVYNGEGELQETIDSILSQEGCDFEFIIVDDGSTDATASILAANASRDTRFRFFSQENQGLTCSLIRGCAEARGKFIARQDCGDVSLPGRLARQVDFLEKHSDAVAVSCFTRILGPGREHLYNVMQSDAGIALGLRSEDPRTLRGPSHHGSVMFRSDAYDKAGCYRPQFYVAQDLDLWTRLIEFGVFHVVPELLYEAVLTPGSVSSNMRGTQVEMTKIIAACGRRKRNGLGDEDLLEQASSAGTRGRKRRAGNAVADFYYFIGGCLRKKDPGTARQYYKAALRANPLHCRAILRLLSFGV